MKRFDTYTNFLFGLLLMLVGSSIDAGTVVARRPQGNRRRPTQLRGRNQLRQGNRVRRSKRNTQKNKDGSKNKWIAPAALCLLGIVGVSIYMKQQGGGTGGGGTFVPPVTDDEEISAEEVSIESQPGLRVEAIDMTTEKKLKEITYGGRFTKKVFRAKSMAEKVDMKELEGMIKSKKDIQDLVQMRVPDLYYKQVGPQAARRNFGAFLAEVYTGESLSYNLPGLQRGEPRKKFGRYLRMMLNLLMDRPKVFGFKSKSDKKFIEMQKQELKALHAGMQACNGDSRKYIARSVDRFLALGGNLKDQAMILLEQHKYNTLRTLVMRHDKNVIEIKNESAAFSRNKNSAKYQIAHLPAVYAKKYGPKIGLPPVYGEDKYIKGSYWDAKVDLMPDHYWEQHMDGSRTKRQIPAAKGHMTEDRFVKVFREAFQRELNTFATELVDKINSAKNTYDGKIKDEVGSMMEINFEAITKFIRTIKTEKEMKELDDEIAEKEAEIKYYQEQMDKKTKGTTEFTNSKESRDLSEGQKKKHEAEKKKSIVLKNGSDEHMAYDILKKSKSLKQEIGTDTYTVDKDFVLFALQMMGITDGFAAEYMKKIRKKDPKVTVSYGTKVTVLTWKYMGKDKKHKIADKRKIEEQLAQKKYSEVEQELKDGKCTLYEIKA